MTTFSVRGRIAILRNTFLLSHRVPWIMACTFAVVLAVVLGVPLGWSLREKELTGDVWTYFKGRSVSDFVFIQ